MRLKALVSLYYYTAKKHKISVKCKHLACLKPFQDVISLHYYDKYRHQLIQVQLMDLQQNTVDEIIVKFSHCALQWFLFLIYYEYSMNKVQMYSRLQLH